MVSILFIQTADCLTASHNCRKRCTKFRTSCSACLPWAASKSSRRWCH